MIVLFSLYKAIKFILKKLFDRNNIIGPLKFLMRVLFGLKFSGDKKMQAQMKTLDYMEKMWQ